MMDISQPTTPDADEKPKPNKTRLLKLFLFFVLIVALAFIFDKRVWIRKSLDGFTSHPASALEVKVLAVVTDSLSAMPAVILFEEKENIALPIWIGVNEAVAIEAEIAGEKSPRPLTNDLLKSVMDQLDARLLKVEITSVVERTFYAQLYIQSSDDKISVVDARPSDAIGLAVRFQCPIFVNKKVLEKYGVRNEDNHVPRKTRKI